MITKALFFILVLSVAFIIGFVTAWLYFKRKWETPLGELQGEMLNKNAELKKLELEIQNLKKKLAQKEEIVSHSNHIDSTDLLEKHPPTTELISSDLEVKYQALERDNEAMLKRMETLQHELDICKKSKVNNLMFTDGDINNKDDLKLISGIGPFIEKKLNILGIYNFSQISNFDKELINKVTEAIEFFPGRIERDNWVSQAQELYNKKAKL